MFSLYRCKDCNKVFAVTPFDDKPETEYLPEEGTHEEKSLKNQNDSLSGHTGHHLEKLMPIQNTMVSEQDYREPVKEIYFEATNGRKKFLLKKWRKDIKEPMSYELIQGTLKVIVDACEFREKEIKKEWLRVMSKPLQEKGMIFLTLLKETVTGAKISKDPRLIFDSPNPLVTYQKLPQGCIRMILKRLGAAFTPMERKEIQRFIDEQNQADGVLPLLIRRKFFIEKPDGQHLQAEKPAASMPARIRHLQDRTRPTEYQI